jgi:hypothetical protein
MDSKKIYYQIIDKWQQCCPIGYKEKHHILPKSLGGNNCKSNLVYLPAREHYVCHKLLVKFTSGKDRSKMIFALNLMMYGNRHNRTLRITSHDYKFVREKWASVKISEETKKKQSLAKLGDKNPRFGAVVLNSTRKKLSLLTAGKYNPMFGKQRSEESKNKQSLATKGRTQSNIHKKNVMLATEFLKSKFVAIAENDERILVCGMAQFSRTHKLNCSHICKCLKGKRKSHKGWRFETI